MFDLETRGVYPVDIEYRQRGRVLEGAFPYVDPAYLEQRRRGVGTVADRGRRRKEAFRGRAFSFAVKARDRDIHLLRGHSYDSPLGSKFSRTLRLEDTDDEFLFTATLPPESEQPTGMRDTVLAVRGGLVGGISPGFVVPPADVVPDAEELIPEPGNPDMSIRLINEAVLYELSLVTRPVYTDTSVDLRSDYAVAEQNHVNAPFSEDVWRLL